MFTSFATNSSLDTQGITSIVGHKKALTHGPKSTNVLSAFAPSALTQFPSPHQSMIVDSVLQLNYPSLWPDSCIITRGNSLKNRLQIWKSYDNWAKCLNVNRAINSLSGYPAYRPSRAKVAGGLDSHFNQKRLILREWSPGYSRPLPLRFIWLGLLPQDLMFDNGEFALPNEQNLSLSGCADGVDLFAARNGVRPFGCLGCR
jgi:hypothetical protein